VVFWRGGLEPFEACKIALVQLTALGLLAGGGMAACETFARRRGRGSLRAGASELLRDPLSVAVLLGTGSAALATLFSISPRTSLQGGHEGGVGLGTVVALAVVYFATRAMYRGAADARLLVYGIAAATAMATGYALVQAVGADPLAWEQTSSFAGWARPIGTLGHPNYLAGYLVMAIPLVLWLASCLANEGRGKTALALRVLAVAGCSVVVISLSRAAWLAGGLMALLTVGVCAWRIDRRGRRWLLLGLTAMILVGGCTAGLSGPIRARIGQMAEMSSRRALWATAWRIFQHHPVTGCGLDTFDLAFGRYRRRDYWEAEWGVVPTRAHNDLLHMLATQGTAGAVAYLALAGALAWAVCRAWRRGGEGERRLTLALGAAVLAWYVQNQFGFPVAATASLFAVLAALLSRLAWPAAGAARQQQPGPRSISPSLPMARAAQGLVGAAAATAAFFLVARPYLAGCSCREGEELLAVDPREALACQERAVRLDGGRDILHAKLAATALDVSRQTPNPQESGALLLRARRALEEACSLVRASGQNHANRGRCLEVLARAGLARPEEVLEAFDEALLRDPLNTAFLADAGRAASGLGLRERARDYLGRGLRIDPRLAVLHGEMGGLALAERNYPEAEAHLYRAVTGDWHGNAEGWDRARALVCLLRLETGQLQPALGLADDLLLTHPDSAPVRWLRARALERLGRRQEARDEYERIVRGRPDHPQARAALARLTKGKR
jgi:O-antigen ligase/tetratricopeptide (TPR) repeat protein